MEFRQYLGPTGFNMFSETSSNRSRCWKDNEEQKFTEGVFCILLAHCSDCQQLLSKRLLFKMETGEAALASTCASLKYG